MLTSEMKKHSYLITKKIIFHSLLSMFFFLEYLHTCFKDNILLLVPERVGERETEREGETTFAFHHSWSYLHGYNFN